MYWRTIIKIYFGFLVSLTALIFCFSVKAETVSPRPVPALGNDTLSSARAHTVFEKVVQLRLYVCNYRWGEGLPDLLKPNELAKEEMKFIGQGGLGITYADGKTHSPAIITNQPCEQLYDSEMEKPGTLNFIVKVLPVTKRPADIAKPFAVLTRFIYRPDHENRIATVLRAKPLLIWDLTSNSATLQKEVDETIGWPANYDYRN